MGKRDAGSDAPAKAHPREPVLPAPFSFHSINDNTLTTLAPEKGVDFKSNNTVRVCDQIAVGVSLLFAGNYLGKVSNDPSGRAALCGDVTRFLSQLSEKGVIEDVDPESVACEAGGDKHSVVVTLGGIVVIGAMEKLYMSVVLR